MNATTPAMAWIALGLCYAASAALALAMERHYGQWRRRTPLPAEQTLLRLAGAVLLALAFLCCVAGWGGAMGLVAWCGLFAAGGLLWIVLWDWKPAAALSGLPVAAVIAVVGLAAR